MIQDLPIWIWFKGGGFGGDRRVQWFLGSDGQLFTDGIGGWPRPFPPQWGCPAHVGESAGDLSRSGAATSPGAVEFALRLMVRTQRADLPRLC